MVRLWAFLSKPSNQRLLTFLGGGVVVIVSGIWAVATYIWPAHETPAAVCASGGAIAIGGSAIGSKLTTNSTGGGSTDCRPAGKG